MKKPKYKKYFASLFLSLSFLHVLLSLLTQTWVRECMYKWGRVPPYLYTSSDWPNNLTWSTSYPNTVDVTQGDIKIHLIIFYLGTNSLTYNKCLTTMIIYNNNISRGGKHISNGGTPIYNNNIHQNIYWSYKYNTPSLLGRYSLSIVINTSGHVIIAVSSSSLLS